MSFFSFLTGGSDVAEKVVDGAVSGLDMMFFTSEEKSIASQKILDWKLDYAKATAGMSISRRVIVCAVVAVWVLLVLLMVALGIWLGGDHSSVKFVFKVMAEVVAIPFSIIIGFYFLAHVVGKGKGAP
jgi:hypothetical protein